MAFRHISTDPRIRHCIAITFKAIALAHFEKSIKALNQNCGWPGHFGLNEILQVELETRGVSNTEGNIRVLSICKLRIRALDRPVPYATNKIALLSEAREIPQRSAKGVHRSKDFNRDFLHLALPLAEAIGHRMALLAAIEAEINPKLIASYKSCAIK
ncbi:hypothetical protein PENANT_c019G07677 [Penicillium antarcticum]|uniref:Acyl-CoA dehydrogenase/oxidase C-terminal domain-containing protein n=1 Tax=Penicillium antarcticum TaxID=416450 RepID=A0A1V6Q0W9_9EURO|nr:hypothetical protein PENANT_c019G07677 [Penicillium antarcticum]